MNGDGAPRMLSVLLTVSSVEPAAFVKTSAYRHRTQGKPRQRCPTGKGCWAACMSIVAFNYPYPKFDSTQGRATYDLLKIWSIWKVPSLLPQILGSSYEA